MQNQLPPDFIEIRPIGQLHWVDCDHPELPVTYERESLEFGGNTLCVVLNTGILSPFSVDDLALLDTRKHQAERLLNEFGDMSPADFVDSQHDSLMEIGHAYGTTPKGYPVSEILKNWQLHTFIFFPNHNSMIFSGNLAFPSLDLFIDTSLNWDVVDVYVDG